MNSQTNYSQSQSRRRYARQRPNEVLCINPKSIRWCSGKRGLKNGAPYKVSKSTLQRWKNHYFLYGEPPAITNKYKRKSGCCCLTLNQRKLLKKLALDNPECYLDEFQ